MNNIFSKRQDFFGFNEPVEYEHEYEEDGDGYQNLYQEEHSQPILKQNRRQRRQRMERFAVASEPGMESTMNNVVTMPRVVNAILIIEPCSLEEMPQVIQALQKRESVMLNLTMMDPEQAQRAVDFVAGGIYSIEGHQERLGERIFLFTPSSVQISKHSSVAHEVPQRQWHPNRPMTPNPA